jgi:hypothetical protein
MNIQSGSLLNSWRYEMIDPLVQLHSQTVVLETREQLVEQLRGIIQWVTNQNQSMGVLLDEVSHKLESLAFQRGTSTLADVKRERDAARIDLHRIGEIVANPLVLIEDEVARIFGDMKSAVVHADETEQPIARPNV